MNWFPGVFRSNRVEFQDEVPQTFKNVLYNNQPSLVQARGAKEHHYTWRKELREGDQVDYFENKKWSVQEIQAIQNHQIEIQTKNKLKKIDINSLDLRPPRQHSQYKFKNKHDENIVFDDEFLFPCYKAYERNNVYEYISYLEKFLVK